MLAVMPGQFGNPDVRLRRYAGRRKGGGGDGGSAAFSANRYHRHVAAVGVGPGRAAHYVLFANGLPDALAQRGIQNTAGERSLRWGAPFAVPVRCRPCLEGMSDCHRRHGSPFSPSEEMSFRRASRGQALSYGVPYFRLLLGGHNRRPPRPRLCVQAVSDTSFQTSRLLISSRPLFPKNALFFSTRLAFPAGETVRFVPPPGPYNSDPPATLLRIPCLPFPLSPSTP